MARRYDIAIIGAGAAGLPALNGVCQRTGNFISSKTFIEFANACYARHALEMPALQGVTAFQLNSAALMQKPCGLRRVLRYPREWPGSVAGGAPASASQHRRPRAPAEGHNKTTAVRAP